MITILLYDPTWPAAFETEARALRDAFGTDALRIEHVGSTAVPGLAAKPVIDIQVAVASLAPLEPHARTLASLGYHFISVGDFDLVYPFFAKPAAWPSTHHVHLCAAGGEQEARHLAFRDHLRRDRDAAVAYEALKRRLAVEHHGTTIASREEYSLAKTAFVECMLTRAGFAWPQPR